MPNCPHCQAPASEFGDGLPPAYECGTVGLSRSRECRIRQAVAFLSKFTSPGSVTENHSIANRALEILTGDVREYR